MSAYEKCEMLLKNYNNYKLGLTTDSGKVAKRLVKKIGYERRAFYLHSNYALY